MSRGTRPAQPRPATQPILPGSQPKPIQNETASPEPASQAQKSSTEEKQA